MSQDTSKDMCLQCCSVVTKEVTPMVERHACERVHVQIRYDVTA